MVWIGGVYKFMVDGGIYMWIIAFVAVVGLAIAIDRFVALWFRYSIDADDFVEQVKRHIAANHLDRAIKLCSQLRDTALARVFRAGLQNANKDDERIHAALHEASLEVVPEVTNRTDYLFLVAQVATYLGLLGTIFGMIDAFDAVANAPPEEKATALASAISVAMNTTALGLAVAVPASIAVGALKGKTNQIIHEIDLHGKSLRNLLAERLRGQSSQG